MVSTLNAAEGKYTHTMDGGIHERLKEATLLPGQLGIPQTLSDLARQYREQRIPEGVVGLSVH